MEPGINRETHAMNRGLRTLVVLTVALVAALAASYFAYLGMRRMALSAARVP